ncbi:MAG TPA: vWA domain-containing protein [Polyangia bacterium]|jgi:hypothetical protein
MSEPRHRQRTLTTVLIALGLILIGVSLWLTAAGRPAAVAAPLVPAPLPDQLPAEAHGRPRIDVVFALDTTGSMEGLIAGAKAKIWSIASQIAAGKPTPDLRIGLIAYRDRGDEYVTRQFPLSRNMDDVYANLMSFSASAGGDRPEDVISALDGALGGMAWDRSKQALRLVFLVGDSPAHEDYRDQPTLADVMRRASAAGIIINTIRCGDAADTEQMWRRVSRGTGGAYASVAQSGGWMQIATPYDTELSSLNARLNETFIPYGEAGEQAAAARRMHGNAAMAAPAAASSAAFRARAGYLDSNDALSVIAKGGKLDGRQLGAGLAGKSADEQRAVLSQKAADRDELNRKIQDLAKKRDDYVKREADKRGGGGMESEVTNMLRSQAGKVGVRY